VVLRGHPWSDGTRDIAVKEIQVLDVYGEPLTILSSSSSGAHSTPFTSNKAHDGNAGTYFYSARVSNPYLKLSVAASGLQISSVKFDGYVLRDVYVEIYKNFVDYNSGTVLWSSSPIPNTEHEVSYTYTVP
jgi:hypothetical protein